MERGRDDRERYAIVKADHRHLAVGKREVGRIVIHFLGRALSSAAARSGGSGDETSTSSPVTGCVNASRVAWRNCRSSPSTPGLPVGRVARDRQVDRLEVDADLMRPPRLEPHAQQRVAVEQLLELEVRDRRARRVGVERVPHAVAAVAADRRVDRPAPRARLADDEREVLAHELAPAHEPLQLPRAPRASAPRPSARTCRGRGGGRSPAALLLPARGAGERERVRERAARVARRRDGRRRPPALSTTKRCSSSYAIVSSGGATSGTAASGSGVSSTLSPPASLWLLPSAAPSTTTPPASSSRSAAPREPTSGSPASQRSRRIPAASGGTRCSVTRGRRGRARRG